MVTFASIAPSTPSFTIFMSSNFLFKAATVAKAMAFPATLLLFNPLAIGMFDQVSTLAPNFPSRLKYSRTLSTVFSIRTESSVGSDIIVLSTIPGSSVSLTPAFVHKSTPMAAPLPVAMAFIIVAAPWDIASAFPFNGGHLTQKVCSKPPVSSL